MSTGEAVFPAFLPGEILPRERLERDPVRVVVESPPRRDVPDHEDAPAVEGDRQPVEAAPNPLDGLTPRLALRPRLLEMAATFAVEQGARHAVQRPVVALAEPPVVGDGDSGARECDLGCLNRAGEVGAEDLVDTVVPASLAEQARLLPPGGRKGSLVPAGCDSGLVVGARRVRLEDDLDAHASTLVAGPVRSASPPTKRTVSSPPGKTTTTGSAPKAAATATALEPEEAVSPAPRSQTRASIPAAVRRATCTFVRRGNLGCTSSNGPMRGSCPGSPSTTACGFPTSTVVRRMPSTSSGSPTDTGPRFCSTRPSGSIRARTCRGPTCTVTSSAPVRSASQRAAMRVPFPDISAREPSGFQIAISSQSSPVRKTSRIPSASPTAERMPPGASGPSSVTR